MKPLRHLIFIRHGESEWNVGNRQESDDLTPLTERGMQQPRVAGAWIKRWLLPVIGEIDVFETSTKLRAVQTAQQLDLTDTWQENPLLRERDWGEYGGADIRTLRAELLAQDQDIFSPDFRPPGGESSHDLMLRIQEADRDLRSKAPGGNLIAVIHGAWSTHMRAHYEGGLPDEDKTKRLGNAGILMYSSVDPESGSASDVIRWVSDVDTAASPTLPVWQEFEPQQK